MRVLVSYVSKSGNTETFVPFIQKHIKADEIVIDKCCSELFDSYDLILLGCYSWGSGKIPKDFKEYIISQKDSLRDKLVFVFGSGLSIYPKFCGSVDGVIKIVSDCEANVLGSFKFEQRFNEEEHDDIKQIIQSL